MLETRVKNQTFPSQNIKKNQLKFTEVLARIIEFALDFSIREKIEDLESENCKFLSKIAKVK